MLVDGVRDYAIFLLDVDGKVRSWNAGAQLMFGYSAADALGRSFSMLYPPAEAARLKPKLQLERAARGERVEEEAWRVRSDGMRFWAHVDITPLRDQYGELYGYGTIVRDLTESQRRDEELKRTQDRSARFFDQAIKDPLTAVFNRRYLYEHVRGEMERGGERAPASLLAFDIDSFKSINDRLGHDKGDIVLTAVAAIARRQCRANDMLFRIGGDEFVVYLPGVDATGALHLAERLRASVERAHLPETSVSISVGVAERRLEDSLETWLQRADAALYRAKDAGRNRVES
jgi:diguanylate cyclase (GGDEF)-like protein/PAS domain S-box-containing protein